MNLRNLSLFLFAFLILTGKSQATIDFQTQVRPILEAHCFQCHGPKKQKGNLRLDALSPRSPRASPLWQLVHHGWDDFLADFEKQHRKSLGPLPSSAVATVQSFLSCGDLASGFTRLQCPD